MNELAPRKQRVQVVYRHNHLKDKISPSNNAPVSFSQEVLQRAEEIIQNNQHLAEGEIKKLVADLNKRWEIFKEQKTADLFDDLIKASNYIIDIAVLYNINTIAYYSDSLRVFLEDAEISNMRHYVIIQAHVDIITISQQKNILSQENQNFIVLKKMLQRAIDQNTPHQKHD